MNTLILFYLNAISKLIKTITKCFFKFFWVVQGKMIRTRFIHEDGLKDYF